MGACAQCGRKGLVLRTSRVECELNGGHVAVVHRSGGAGPGVRVEACANSGDFCDGCFPTRPYAPVLLSLFDEEAYLGEAQEEFAAWLKDPSRQARHVMFLNLCTPECLHTILAGRVRARVARSGAETRWQLKVSEQTYTDASGARLRYVSLFWFGEAAAMAMPGGMLVRHCLPTKEACRVYDTLFGGPLAPREEAGPQLPNLIYPEGDAAAAQAEMADRAPAVGAKVSAYVVVARQAESEGKWDEAIRLYELGSLPDEARGVKKRKAEALAAEGRFKEAGEIFEALGLRKEAKSMRRRDFEQQASESGFEQRADTAAAPPPETAAPPPPPAGDVAQAAPGRQAPRRAGWTVCRSCRKLLGRGFDGEECPICGAPLVRERSAP